MASSPALTGEPAPTATPTATSTATPTAAYEQCAWQWATQPLSELSAEVQAALEAAGLEGAAVRAEAYGENCLSADNEVLRFAAMETDFHIVVEVESLEDREYLGSLLERILIVLDDFPPGATPGPQPGYIGVRFEAGTGELNLWFTVTDGEAVRAMGLHGTALLEELQQR
jgi:hypothetical protein